MFLFINGYEKLDISNMTVTKTPGEIRTLEFGPTSSTTSVANINGLTFIDYILPVRTRPLFANGIKGAVKITSLKVINSTSLGGIFKAQACEKVDLMMMTVTNF